jgi:PAS domain S-box-containing protein
VNFELSVDTLDRQAIDALPVALCLTDRDGRVVRFNQRAMALWGRAPTPADLQRAPAAQVIRTGQAVRDVAVVIERQDGASITASVTSTPITDSSGLTIAAMSTFVENAVDSDAALHRARLAAIVVSSTDAILSKTLDGLIESWNIGAERVFGYTAEEAVGQHISLITPPDRLHEESDVLTRLRHGETIDHFETVRRAKDGRLVDVSMAISPIKAADGRIVGASNVARDITERRLADEALSRSRRRYQRIFEAAGVSIWDEDFTAVRAALDELRASGVSDFATYFADHPDEVKRCMGLVRVVDVNETTLRMFGAVDKRALLASLSTVYTPEARDIFAQELVSLAEGHSGFEAESVLRTLHGDRVDVLVSITFPASSEPADSVLVTLTDITLQKLAEQARRDSEALFHEMADTAPAMLWISDPTGAWTFLSRQWYELTGQEPENALGLGWLKVLHPDDRDSAARCGFRSHGSTSSVSFRVSAVAAGWRLAMDDYRGAAAYRHRRRVPRIRRERDRHHRASQSRRSGHRRSTHARDAVACWCGAGLRARSRHADSSRNRRRDRADLRAVGRLLLLRRGRRGQYPRASSRVRDRAGRFRQFVGRR